MKLGCRPGPCSEAWWAGGRQVWPGHGRRLPWHRTAIPHARPMLTSSPCSPPANAPRAPSRAQVQLRRMCAPSVRWPRGLPSPTPHVSSVYRNPHGHVCELEGLISPPLEYQETKGGVGVWTPDLNDTRFTPPRGFLPHSGSSQGCGVVNIRGVPPWVGLALFPGDIQLPILIAPSDEAAPS